MAFINKNANLVLLFLIVVSVAFLVGATIFYQSAMQRVNTRYNDKVTQLKGIESELQAKMGLLDRVKRDLELKAAREESFTQKYTDIRTTNEQLEKTKITLESEKGALEKKSRDLESQMSNLQSDLAYERAKIAQLQEDINQLEEDYDDAEEEVDYWKKLCEATEGCG